jgi:hypothetical protein
METKTKMMIAAGALALVVTIIVIIVVVNNKDDKDDKPETGDKPETAKAEVDKAKAEATKAKAEAAKAKAAKAKAAENCGYGKWKIDGVCKDIVCKDDEEIDPIKQTCRKVGCSPGMKFDVTTKACKRIDQNEINTTFTGKVKLVWGGPHSPMLVDSPYYSNEISRVDSSEDDAFAMCNRTPNCFAVITRYGIPGGLLVTGPKNGNKIRKRYASGMYLHAKEAGRTVVQ